MHREAYEYVQGWVKGRMFRYVVEFGSLDINGSVRGLFNCARYHGIDLQDGPGVDEIADAALWRHPGNNGWPDVVVCCEVLEHAPNVEGIVFNAYQNLRPGGLFLVTCAADPRRPHSAVDGGQIREGEHYANVSPGELETIAEMVGFAVQDVQHHTDRGDLYMRAKKR
jgi:SAM-dependent methyltransferase